MAALPTTGMRPTDMPELPEVETIRKALMPKLIGMTFLKPEVFCSRLLSCPSALYQKQIEGRTVVNLERRGKYLLFVLDDGTRLLFHLRMEGKLFVVPKAKHSTAHLSCFLPFKDSPDGLAFYDVRKFGVSQVLRKGEEGPLARLGPEPLTLTDSHVFFESLRKTSRPLKEALMDQSVIAGLGNIYADEVCFATQLSPFRKSSSVTEEEAARLLSAIHAILRKAIRNHGSTIRSFQASESLSGSYQNALKVYGREGKKCLRCHQATIEKRVLNGRGTCVCPHCQKTGISVGITGKIGSGKSLALSYFAKSGYVTLSCDEEVRKAYRDSAFRTRLLKKFPEIGARLNRKKITTLLLSDKGFRRSYDAFLFAEVRSRVNDFFIANDGRNKAVEVPLLFDAHMEKDFTYIIGTETTKQEKHLKERGDSDIPTRLSFNALNSYDRNRHQLDAILNTNGSKRNLEKQVKELVRRFADAA